ncbi:aminoglycoside phosphotransferase family protein [Nesterenkonia sp. MY13]|uniref:Aminoglycoside phosphotransferase family protein n=1 Tax=Nesterenkonia sedimenti TaxID=1463632 RepID=A0A7X8YCR5_9MICC|nr:aminoglycoside phosphotransferase family protein [Nesterenkonia sedimenti]NLS08873.1 aminoglycoside phosphotransferase family protein [Nesterenkonia sedimenti]
MPEQLKAQPVATTQDENSQLSYLQQADLVQPHIAAALQRTSGITAEGIHLESVQHRPGAGVTGIYRVALPGGIDEAYVGITTERLRHRSETALSADSPQGQLTLWQHPYDPALPGLQRATDPAEVVRIWGGGRRLTGLETISYRPLRRAVIAADFDDGARVYLKVLRTGRAEELDARHRLLLDAGIPAPVPVKEPVDDVVALHQGQGVSLAEYFLADGGATVRPQDFVDLLDAMPADVMALPARDAWTDRLPAYASAAVAALPDCQRRIRRLEEEILAGIPVTDRGPVVPTHGDFYEANVLIRGSKVSCLLDVDSLGPGHRVDDLACFLGHLAVLPAVDSRYVHAPAGFDRFARVFAEGVDPESLRIRSASVALSLVAGARDARRTGWEPAAEHRLRCAEVLLGLTPPAGDLPHWPAVL